MLSTGGSRSGANQGYGTLLRENGRFLEPFVRSPLKPQGAGRITAVLSVSQSDGTFIMTSQDLDNPERVPNANFFFSSVSALDSLLIGGSDNSGSGYQFEMDGTIYFVEIYDTPFTEAQAEAKIKETYPSSLPPPAVSYVQTGDRTFKFNIESIKSPSQTTTYSWVFPRDDQSGSPPSAQTSDKQSPTWEAPTGNSDPFKGGGGGCRKGICRNNDSLGWEIPWPCSKV